MRLAVRPGPTRRSAVPAPVLVLGAIVSVQVGSALATSIFGAVGPGGAVALRLGLAAALLCVLTRPRPSGYGLSTLASVAAFGVVLAVMNLAFYAAIDRVPLGVAVTIEFLGPLGVAVAGSRRFLDGLWVLLAAAGVALLSAGGGRVRVSGIVLALVAGGCWAGYILLSQRVGRLVPGTTGLALALVVGGIVMLPVGIVAGGGALLRPRVLGVGLAVAVLSSVVPYSLELAALRRLSASVFGVLMSLEPAMGALAGLVVLGQPVAGREIVAIAMVSAASAGATLAHRRRGAAGLTEPPYAG